MISLQTAWAMILRHIRVWKHDPNIPLTFLYWPLLDILTWGFLGTWISQSQTTGEFANYQTTAIVCLLLFQIASRSCNAINAYFHEELHASNIINLFSMPLSLANWIYGLILYTTIITSLILASCTALTLALYPISLVLILKAFGLFGLPLFLCALWVGFISLSAVTLLGKRGMEVAWIISWFFSPFSGAYFPTTVLPAWGQTISSHIPLSYLFAAAREWLNTGTLPLQPFMYGFGMSIVYAAGSIVFFVYCFNRSREKGLARLMD